MSKDITGENARTRFATLDGDIIYGIYDALKQVSARCETWVNVVITNVIITIH